LGCPLLATNLLGVFKHILVGTDGSKTAAVAVSRAVEVAKAVGAKVTIFSVGSAARAGRTVEEEAKKHADSGVTIATETAEGDAAGTIVDRAEKGDVDLLVLGNKGMTGASRFFLGSVPNKVSHHTPVALLIVRTT
jgi:nucleotide-binding universal stress UspA family protein